jgi:hypothetical protein
MQKKKKSSQETPEAAGELTNIDPTETADMEAKSGKKTVAEKNQPPAEADNYAANAEESEGDGEEMTADQDEGGSHQPHHQYQQVPLPPGYAIEPATGRIFQIGEVPPYPTAPVYAPMYYQPPPASTPPQPTPEQLAEMAASQAAAQHAAQQRHGQIVQTMEQFLSGEATVSDVVKTMYLNTSQDDQLWKGAIVGAAAAVLLTSKPIRQAMGKTLGGIFPGLKEGGSVTKKTNK